MYGHGFYAQTFDLVKDNYSPLLFRQMFQGGIENALRFNVIYFSEAFTVSVIPHLKQNVFDLIFDKGVRKQGAFTHDLTVAINELMSSNTGNPRFLISYCHEMFSISEYLQKNILSEVVTLIGIACKA